MLPPLESLADRFFPVFLRKYVDRVCHSKIGVQIASGAFWSLVGSVSSRVLMVIAAVIVARLLGRTIYGQYSVVLSTVNTFIVFANFGLAMMVTKYVAEFRDTDKDRTGRIIGLSYIFTTTSGIVLTIVFCLFAPLICNHVLNAPELIHELRIGILFLIIAAINGAQNGVLIGFQDFRAIAIANLFAGVLMIPLRAGGAYLGGLNGSIVGFGLSLVVLLAINRFFITRILKKNSITISFNKAFREWPVLWKFSLPAALSGIMVAPVFWICYLMLARTRNGFDEVALLDAARQFQLMILFIPGTISQIILPLLVRTNSATDQRRYIKVVKYNLVLNISVALLIAIPMVLFSPWIMEIYGKGFSGGTSTLRILALAAIVMTANSVIGQILASKERLWVGLLFNLLWAVVFITGCYITISQNMGAFGIAFAMLIAYLMHSIWQYAYLISYSKSAKR